MAKKIAVADIETTGFLWEGGTICEVGVVELDLETGARSIVFDSLCVEQSFLDAPHDAWIFNNSSLKQEDVLKAPAFKSIAGNIQDVIDNYSLGITAYNNSFDFSFLESRGVQIPVKLACPMKLSTPICKLPARHPSHGRYKWPSFEEAWSHFFPDDPYTEAHRGADDAYHEARLVYELYQQGVFSLK